MAVRSLVWLGVRTPRFTEMVTFYQDVLGLEVIAIRPDDARFRLADGTEVHVYGLGDEDHAFFGPGPVVGLLVDDFEAARRRMLAAGIEFIGSPQRAGATTWNHFRGPDGNIYEVIAKG